MLQRGNAKESYGECTIKKLDCGDGYACDKIA